MVVRRQEPLTLGSAAHLCALRSTTVSSALLAYMSRSLHVSRQAAPSVLRPVGQHTGPGDVSKLSNTMHTRPAALPPRLVQGRDSCFLDAHQHVFCCGSTRFQPAVSTQAHHTAPHPPSLRAPISLRPVQSEASHQVSSQSRVPSALPPFSVCQRFQ